MPKNSIVILLFLYVTLIINPSFANVPGGGTGTGANVTVTETSTTVTMSNGIISATISKSSATISNYSFNGYNMLSGGYSGGQIYWTWNMPNFQGPYNCVYTLNVNPNSNNGDYAEIQLHMPWTGLATEAAMDVDIYYSLKRGAQGIYAAAMLTHQTSYPANPGGEWRMASYPGSTFDWLSVDSLRNVKMAKPSDSAVSVSGAPKEVSMWTSGSHKNLYECKYDYSADFGDINVWGWGSTTRNIGIWVTAPSKEYYNGGPKKRELMCHSSPVLLNMLNGEHYGMGGDLNMDSAEYFRKVYGPFLIYCNSVPAGTANAPLALWADAQTQALAEQAAWPYTWFNNSNYLQENQRGTVTGKLVISDTTTPNAVAANMWIGVAATPYSTSGVTDFQMWSKNYQFWVKTDSVGNFTIPHVHPGTYNIYAFGPSCAGQMTKLNYLTVTAGYTTALGNVVWTPTRTAPTIWEIGIPDRSAGEYKHGTDWWTSDTFPSTHWGKFMDYPDEFPNGVNYTIGRSNYATDWNFVMNYDQSVQTSAPVWTVNFNLTSIPKTGSSTAALYTAIAASFTSALIVKVNGTLITTPTTGTYMSNQSDAKIRKGIHGAYADVRLLFNGNLLKAGANNITISLRCTGGATVGDIMFDYVRLEAANTSLQTYPTITSAVTASGRVGTVFTYTITSNNPPITSYTIASGALPSGLTLNTSTGVISGTPAAGTYGTYPISVYATNATGAGNAQTITITIADVPSISSVLSATGIVGAEIPTYTITGNYSPTSFNATGLPTGLSVNTSTGEITGTPSAAGTYNATISATNITGTGSATLVFTIAAAPNYYFSGTGALNDYHNWYTSINAGGIQAYSSVFSQANTNFHVLNSANTSSNSGTWTVNGSGSSINVGSAISAGVTVVINSSKPIVGTINVKPALSGTNILNIQDATLPTMGTISAGSTVVYGASVAQTITGNSTYSNLIINNTSGVTIASGNNSVAINGLLMLQSGTLTTNGNLTLISDSSLNYGLIAPVGASGNTGSINGNVTIQRYIPAKTARRYSFLGSPIAQSFRNAWQQQIYITGAGTGGTSCGTTTGDGITATDKYNTNGFDVTSSNASSVFTYSSSLVNGSHWIAIPNTKNTNITPGIGYRVNIRGNRNSSNVSCANQLASSTPTAPEAVTLSATGAITTGDVTVALNNPTVHSFTLLANPYPSKLSFTTFKLGNTNINNKMWTYSPWSSGNYTTYSAGVIANGAAGFDNVSGDFLAPGQAFFVEANTAGSVTFHESHKAMGTIPNSKYFGLNNIQLIRIGLKGTNGSLLDEVVARFNTNGSATIIPEWDAVSFSSGHSLAILKQETKLAIATLPANYLNDTIHISINSSTNGIFNLVFSNFDGIDTSASITLQDKYLNSSQDIRLNPTYSFSATSDTNSVGNNRFRLVIKPSNSVLEINKLLATATLKQGNVYLNWINTDSKFNGKYAIEKSAEGKLFHQIGIANSVHFIDSALSTATNYYRIKAMDQTGIVTYSNIAIVQVSEKSNLFTLFPNPVKGNTVGILFNNVATGNYVVFINNVLGQKVGEASIIHQGNNANNSINLNKSLTAGTYWAIIKEKGSGRIVYQTKLFVQP